MSETRSRALVRRIEQMREKVANYRETPPAAVCHTNRRVVGWLGCHYIDAVSRTAEDKYDFRAIFGAEPGQASQMMSLTADAASGERTYTYRGEGDPLTVRLDGRGNFLD